MAFIVSGACIDVMDRSCLGECPVDCIYEGDRKLYIHPGECIECGACEPACPTEAIFPARKVPADQTSHIGDNRRFFSEPLPGRPVPLGSPGGSQRTGRIGVDTPLVASL